MADCLRLGLWELYLLIISLSFGMMDWAQISCAFSLGCVVSGIISLERNPFSSKNSFPMSMQVTLGMSLSRLGR